MTAWLFALLVAVAPPGRVPERETEAAAIVRYQAIAEDLDAVTAEQAPLFPGPDGRAMTAGLLVAIAVHESGLRLDVDQGATRGGGQDVCLLQLRSPRHDVATDRRACFREGLRLARQSFAACRALERRDRLAAYASGSCAAGRRESRAILDSWRRMLFAHPYPRAGS